MYAQIVHYGSIDNCLANYQIQYLVLSQLLESVFFKKNLIDDKIR